MSKPIPLRCPARGRVILFSLAACLLLVGAGAYGQTADPAPSILPGDLCADVYNKGLHFLKPVRTCAPSTFPILGAPFVATLVQESEIKTRDGKSLVGRGTQKLARDSQGRTRTENPRPPLEGDELLTPESRARIDNLQGWITVNDPVAHLRILMYPNTLVAQLFPDNPPKGASEQGYRRRYPGPVYIHSVPTIEEYLGIDSVNGVRVQHYRITQTYPPAPQCTEPEVFVSDYWYSPELHMNVVTKSLGPRGMHTATLIELSRAEPDPALFKLPAEYTLAREDYAYVSTPWAFGTGKPEDGCPY